MIKDLLIVGNAKEHAIEQISSECGLGNGSAGKGEKGFKGREPPVYKFQTSVVLLPQDYQTQFLLKYRV